LPTKGSVAILKAIRQTAFIVRSFNDYLSFPRPGSAACNMGYFKRRRQIINHRVQGQLNADILQARAGKDRINLVGNHAFPHSRLSALHTQFFPIQIFFSQASSHSLSSYPHSVLLNLFLHIFRNLDLLDLFAVNSLEFIGLFSIRSITPASLDSAPIGSCKATAFGFKPIPDGIKAHIKISSHFIHFIHKTKPGNLIFISLSPNCFRLRLHSGWHRQIRQ
jgi:hypothetical protein